MQVIFTSDPVVPSVEGMKNLQKNVDYWGDRCCKAEAEVERLRKALEEIVQVGGQDLCRGIAAEALRPPTTPTPLGGRDE